MKLVDSQTKEVLFDGGADNQERNFNSMTLKRDLRSGITVPSYMKGTYGGRTVVRISDPDFVEAFRMIYTPRVLNKNEPRYLWED